MDKKRRQTLGTLKLDAETLRVLSGGELQRAAGAVCSGRSVDWGNCTSENACTSHNPPTCYTCLTCACNTPDC